LRSTLGQCAPRCDWRCGWCDYLTSLRACVLCACITVSVVPFPRVKLCPCPHLHLRRRRSRRRDGGDRSGRFGTKVQRANGRHYCASVRAARPGAHAAEHGVPARSADKRMPSFTYALATCSVTPVLAPTPVRAASTPCCAQAEHHRCLRRHLRDELWLSRGERQPRGAVLAPQRHLRIPRAAAAAALERRRAVAASPCSRLCYS
jgi:hypothetical protein